MAMTIEEMRTSEKSFLIPTDVCEVLGCAPYSINVQAKEDPRKLGFPVSVIGTRVKIPRVAFIKWMEGTGMWDNVPDECEIYGKERK